MRSYGWGPNSLRPVSLYEEETSERYVHREKVMRAYSEKVITVKGRGELSPETNTAGTLFLVV